LAGILLIPPWEKGIKGDVLGKDSGQAGMTDLKNLNTYSIADPSK